MGSHTTVTCENPRLAAGLRRPATRPAVTSSRAPSYAPARAQLFNTCRPGCACKVNPDHRTRTRSIQKAHAGCVGTPIARSSDVKHCSVWPPAQLLMEKAAHGIGNVGRHAPSNHGLSDTAEPVNVPVPGALPARILTLHGQDSKDRPGSGPRDLLGFAQELFVVSRSRVRARIARASAP